MEPLCRRATVTLHKEAVNMVKCPFCGYESDISGFKLLRKPWRFRFYTVRMLECPKCHGVFNYYSGVSAHGKRSEFIIKIKLRVFRGDQK